MHRRTIMKTLLATPLAQAKADNFKLSVRVEPLFAGLTLPQQMEKVAGAGYEGFEFGDWRVPDAAQIVRLKNRLGLECACIVGNKSVNPAGMGLCNPRERDGFLAELRASIEAANRFETSRLVVLTGFRVPGMSREAQHASVVEGLKRAHDLAAADKIELVLEMINTLAAVEPLNPKGDNHSRYYLNHISEAFEIAREVASPYVKILFDLYHVQIMDGNLIETLRANIANIGHFHVGDVPGRHEPGTGEIDHRNVFRAIRETGYREFVAMEYLPLKDSSRTLKEVKALARGA